jgi:hypothetical protein
LTDARVTVLTQNILDERRKLLAKNFEGGRLGDKRDFIALGYPDMSLFIVVALITIAVIQPVRNSDDNYRKLCRLIKKVNDDNKLDEYIGE